MTLCGCCEPSAPLTPVPVANRPGLSAVAYRVGTYASFRQSMLTLVAGTAELVDLATRADDDYAVTTLDLWAAVADVLTFYQERYANEAYLGTATRRESIRRLSDLLGYTLGPGVAAVAWLAFTVDDAKAVEIPTGVRVQSTPAPAPASPAGSAPAPLPQTFETIEAITADGRLSRLRAYPRPAGPPPLSPGQLRATVARDAGPAVAASLPPGARVVLFNNGSTTPVEEKELAAIAVVDDHVVLEWRTPVGPGWSATTAAFAFSRMLRLFGHNAPAETFSLVPASNVTGVTWVRSTTPTAYPTAGSAVESATQLCFDAKVEGLRAGTQLLVADGGPGGMKTLVTVVAADQVKDSLGGLADTVTRVTVTPAVPGIADRSKVLVYQLSGPQLRFSPASYPERLTESTVYLPGRPFSDELGPAIEVGRTIQGGRFLPGVVLRPSDLAVERRVLLVDDGDTPVLASVTAAPTVEMGPPADGEFAHLAVPLDIGTGGPGLATASAALLGNVAQASHGESVRGEIVGSGTAAASFPTFPLRKQPLTYVPALAAGGVLSSLGVDVNGVRWTEVASLFGQPPTAQVYATRTRDDGTTLLVFGDGLTGTVPPTGESNIVATYRVGSGLAGRVQAGSLTTALDRPLGLKAVANPLPATGGADPETADAARANAPRTVRTFGRAVSLRDFEDLVSESGEVAKASATIVWDGLDKAVFLTVAAEGGAAFAVEDLARLAASLTAARDPNHRLLIANYVAVPVSVVARLTVAASHAATVVAAAVRAALVDALSFDRLHLAEPVHLSDVYRVIQDVPGVVGADIERLMFARPPGMTASAFDLFLSRRGVVRLPDGNPDPVQGHLRIFPARAAPPNPAAPAAPGLVLPAELASVASPSQDIDVSATGGSGS